MSEQETPSTQTPHSGSARREELGPPTGICVDTTLPLWRFVWKLCKTRVFLDDQEPTVRPWGKTYIPTEPGEHSVTCYLRYLYFQRAMQSTISVTVVPGGVVHLKWKARFSTFLPGVWTLCAE